jgi:type III pantothenate kinase
VSEDALREEKLLFAVDVGNTNIKLGLFRRDELIAHWRLATESQRMADEYAALLGVLLQHRGLSFSSVAAISLSSTVPGLVAVFRELAERYFCLETPFLEVTPSARTGITLAIDNPQEIGPDRIVDALAVVRLHRVPAIVVDFGTATTFDAIDAEGRLLGTAIAPGFLTAMEGLFQRAARLSRVDVQRPSSAIGSNTAAALRSGWIFGYVGLVEGLVRRIQTELGGNALVVATGGLADEVIAETDVVDICDPLLTLKGLRLFYELNRDALGEAR